MNPLPAWASPRSFGNGGVLEEIYILIVIGEAPDAPIGSSGVAEGKWSGILSVVASVQWGLLDEELSPDVYNRGYGDISHWKGK